MVKGASVIAQKPDLSSERQDLAIPQASKWVSTTHRVEHQSSSWSGSVNAAARADWLAWKADLHATVLRECCVRCHLCAGEQSCDR